VQRSRELLGRQLGVVMGSDWLPRMNFIENKESLLIDLNIPISRILSKHSFY